MSLDSSISNKPRRARSSEGPDARWSSPSKQDSYLIRRPYRETSLFKVFGRSEAESVAYIASVRWGQHGKGKQVCPECGAIETHYPVAKTLGWKCRAKDCAKMFSVFSGTRLHGQQIGAMGLLSVMLHFVEAKDSISSRELAGLHDMNHQALRVMTLKFREAIQHTFSAEPPLTGYVQCDAAYFMKYVRPSNVGNGASFAAKAVQKNAGLDEDAKTSNKVNPNMHAVVVFVQCGSTGERRYKVATVKTENQVDMLTLGKKFCDENAILVTDQHNAYNYFTGLFLAHFQVNHQKEFMTEDGKHTNYAEGFFARLRAAIHGAWHRTTLAHLEEYAWEFAWRQTMTGRSNQQQLEDLLRRVLNYGRSTRYVDYWNSRGVEKPAEDWRAKGSVMEVDKKDMTKRRGRPRNGTVKPPTPERVKRAYRKAVKPGGADSPGASPSS